MSKFIDRSDEAKAALDAALEAALEAVGIQAEGNVKLLVPVDTGLLRNSITYAISGQEPAIGLYNDDAGKNGGAYSGNAPDDEDKAVYIGTNVEYAPYVEYGTSRTKAQPFIQPGVQNHLTEYKAIFEQYLGQVQI